MKSVHYLRMKITIVMIFSLVICALFSFDVYASSQSDMSDTETIRLGYFNFQHYMIGAEENQVKSGFAYELLGDVAAINNWNYEFVYGDFNELYRQLLKGEIDILPCLVYTEERAQKHLFSDEEIYSELYFISALNEDVDSITDISMLDGKRLSTVTDCYQNVVFEEWAASNGISMELVCTDSFEDSWEQLRDGRADFILNIDSAAQDSGFTSLFEVGSGSSRFAIAPGREDIHEKMNSAIDTIYEINPFTIDHLKEKYLSKTLSSYRLSENEKAWIKNREFIKIAGLDNDIPYTYRDKAGNTIGVYPGIVSEMFKRLGIDVDVKWELYKTEEEMDLALKSGEVDLVCPYYHDHYNADINDVIISEVFYGVNMGILYNDKILEDDIQVVAIPKSILDTYYVEKLYPNLKILNFKSVDACIDAVASKRADAAIAHVTALQKATLKTTQSFKMTTLSAECPVCFASSMQNGTLICIINRGIHLISEADIHKLEYDNTPASNYEFWAYVKNNKMLVTFICLALLMLLLYAIERNAASIKLKKNLDEITKQKKIIEENERKLIDAEKAANAANKAKSTFLFNMSHDIRTPMNAILGYTDRLLRHIDDSNVVCDSASKIKSSGEYLLSLINDVLDMARIESENVKVEAEVHDIRERAYVLCDIFEVSMQNKNITFNIDFNDMKDTVVCYDSPKLRQIMLNLISNSVKYTNNGGVITHTMRQLPSEREGFGRYEIRVSDDGIGMTQEFVERIFERFSRSDDSITKETQGTGLGMAIVKKLVDLMEGTITVESEPGKGTRITLLFDFRIATEEKKTIPEVNGEGSDDEAILKNLNIFIVDDNELNREILREILEDEGSIIAGIAQNGKIAYEMISKSNPKDIDLIFMDVQMPVMDGYEATRQIRALDNKELANLPIIAMTANAFEEDRRDAIAAGMNEHLTKPLDIYKMKEIVKIILKGNKN